MTTFIGMLVNRFMLCKWKLLVLPILFSAIGIYIIITTGGRISGIKNFAIPAIALLCGWAIPVAIWRRNIFSIVSKEKTYRVNFAFLLFILGVALQLSAMYLDRSFDKVYIKKENIEGYYTEAQLREFDRRLIEDGKKAQFGNYITILRRQIGVGSEQFQVGELAKVTFMIFLSVVLLNMRVNGELKFCRNFFLKMVAILAPPCIMSALMPNYSMAVVFFLLLIFMVLIQQMSIKFRITIFSIIILCIALAMFGFNRIGSLPETNPITQKHPWKRIWLMYNESSEGNSQQNMALRALSNGGLFGMGADKGTVKRVIHAAHDDFAFATLGEEFGFLLLFVIVCLLAYFLLTGFLTATNIKIENDDNKLDAKDKNALLYQNLAFGIMFIFALNIFIHIGVNLHILPNTGQPLSFFSSAGTNLAVNFGLMGMLVQISSLDKENL